MIEMNDRLKNKIQDPDIDIDDLIDLANNYEISKEVSDFVKEEIRQRLAAQRFFELAEDPEMWDDENFDDPVDEMEWLAGQTGR